jgi:hypothetical protein
MMTKPLDPKHIATVQEIAISNMLEIEALTQLLFEKRIISEDESISKFKKLDREIKIQRSKKISLIYLDDKPQTC